MYRMNGCSWSIHLVQNDSPMLRRSDGSYTVGVCDRSTRAVYISNMVHGAFLRKVLIHEVCHSAIFSYGIDLSIDQEELFCDLVATYGDEIFSVVDDLFMALRHAA